MTATAGLSACRTELMEGLEHLRQQRHSAQSGLVSEHMALAGDLIAGPLCLALAGALGAGKAPRRDAALTTALLELSVGALRDLSGEGRDNPLVTANGYPLALNSGDALLSLAHLTLLDLAADVEGLERESVMGFDSLSLAAFAAEAADAGSKSGEAVLGQTAGLLAAIAAGRSELGTALAAFGERAIHLLEDPERPGDIREMVASLPLSPAEQERLAAVLA